jgi:hypothetical protein
MNLGTELQRYLELGMDLQHRRIERGVGIGRAGSNNREEKIKWKQDIREGSIKSETNFPATWGIVYKE